MSRWLWALLGGVVLVAIAAVFWTASNQTNVTPPVSPGPAPVAPAPVPPAPPAPAPVAQEPAPSSAPAPTAQEAAPSPPPSPAPPAAQEAAAPPAPAPTAPPAPTSRCRTASRLAACSRAVPRDALCSARRRAGAPASACSRSARRSAPAAARARTGGAGSPRRIRAQEPRAAGRGLGLFRGGLRAAFPAARRRLGLSAAGGQVRPGRDCRVAEEDPSAFRHLPGRARV